MKEHIINHICYRVFDSLEDQLKNNSLCCFQLKSDEILLEKSFLRDKQQELLDFEIYKKDILDDKVVKSMVDAIKNGYFFTEEYREKNIMAVMEADNKYRVLTTVEKDILFRISHVLKV